MSKPEFDSALVPSLEAILGKTSAYHNRWSIADEAKMTRYYGKVPTRELCKILDKSLCSVHTKASRMGLCYTKQEG